MGRPDETSLDRPPMRPTPHTRLEPLSNNVFAHHAGVLGQRGGEMQASNHID